MSASVTGSVSLSVNMNVAIPTGANVLNGYTVTVNPSPASASYSPGTAANQANKIYQYKGSAVAATVDLDLTAAVCVDGTTGFSHVREKIVYNDDAVNNLTLGLGTNPFTPYLGGTTPTVIIPPGSVFRIPNPLGTNGWVVDSTHKIVRVDPGANTIAYRMIIIGD